MGHPKYTKEEIAARGRSIYEGQIKEKVEPDHLGEFLVIDIETGDYELGDDEFDVSKRAHAKHPDGAFFGMRVGRRSSGTIGASAKSTV